MSTIYERVKVTTIEGPAGTQVVSMYDLRSGIPIAGPLLTRNGRTPGRTRLRGARKHIDQPYSPVSHTNRVAHSLVYERLFPFPGLCLRLPSKVVGVPESAEHHERTVDCVVQVYRILKPVYLERLAEIELGDASETTRFRELDERMAQVLNLHNVITKTGPSKAVNNLGVAQPGKYLWTGWITSGRRTAAPTRESAHAEQ